jgi:hypothetical protein
VREFVRFPRAFSLTRDSFNDTTAPERSAPCVDRARTWAFVPLAPPPKGEL